MDRQKQQPRVQAAAGIEYHADDYGLFPTQSQRILRCREQGRLNGVSIMPNGEELAQSMALLEQAQKHVAVTIHLNLMEGQCLALPREVPLLTDAQGNLSCSFGRLLAASFLPGRNALRQQLKLELRSQIRAVQCCLEPGQPLRLDGHAHYHMIPVVFDAMMDVIREDGLDIRYIRIPREYLGIYLGRFWRIRGFSPVNLVKVLVLNVLAFRSRIKYGAYLRGLEQRLFMGVFLSGRMLRENVEPFLDRACRLADRKHIGLEILAHPGGVYEPEDQEKLTNSKDFTFLTSPMRDREASLFLVNEAADTFFSQGVHMT